MGSELLGVVRVLRLRTGSSSFNLGEATSGTRGANLPFCHRVILSIERGNAARLTLARAHVAHVRVLLGLLGHFQEVLELSQLKGLEEKVDGIT